MLDNTRILNIYISFCPLRRANKTIGSGIGLWADEGLLEILQ